MEKKNLIINTMAEFDAAGVKERALVALLKNSSDPEGKIN